MFFPGETITHRFIIPFSADSIDKVIISYKQNGAIMFEKIITDDFLEEEPNYTTIIYQLTQGEGLLFADNSPFTIQLNVYTHAGSRHTSYELKGNSGIQYVRNVIDPEELKITIQPKDWKVTQVGETAVFSTEGTGVAAYTWQYSVNNGSWKNWNGENNKILTVTATQELIDNYRFKCVLMGTAGGNLETNVVSFINKN